MLGHALSGGATARRGPSSNVICPHERLPPRSKAEPAGLFPRARLQRGCHPGVGDRRRWQHGHFQHRRHSVAAPAALSRPGAPRAAGFGRWSRSAGTDGCGGILPARKAREDRRGHRRAALRQGHSRLGIRSPNGTDRRCERQPLRHAWHRSRHWTRLRAGRGSCRLGICGDRERRLLAPGARQRPSRPRARASGGPQPGSDRRRPLRGRGLSARREG